MTFAVALPFDSGILLATDTTPRRLPGDPPGISSRRYGSALDTSRSVMVTAAGSPASLEAVARCEQALAALPPDACTIEEMRGAIAQALLELYPEGEDERLDPSAQMAMLVALYSAAEKRCALLRTGGPSAVEHVGYDCQGPAAHVGHYLIHDRYTTAQSLNGLDLTSVFSLALDAVEGVRRQQPGRSGAATSIVVLYANGHVSEVAEIGDHTRRQRKLAAVADLDPHPSPPAGPRDLRRPHKPHPPFRRT
jgi:hypothetical protein